MAEDDSPQTCSKCNAPIQPGSRFCKECGTPVDTGDTPVDSEAVTEKPSLSCPHCGVSLKPGDIFCTECGEKVDIITSCPKCFASVTPGNKFCKECGVNVYQYQVSQKKEPVDELKKTGKDLMKDAEKTGRGLMKEVGGFLQKTGSTTSKKKKITPQKNRYLVCESCGGYYQLQPGEEPEDFSSECECGGPLVCKNTKE